MTTLNRPDKVDQAAALIRTVFEANPGVRMTRRDIEETVDLSAFSLSTIQRALWHVGGVEHTSTYPPEGPEPNIYWLPNEMEVRDGQR